MAEIRIESVTKAFGDKVAVDDVSLTVHDREFLVLLGPSGCGKTTLLRTIAGLGMADSGRISIGGRDVTYLPPGERQLSMVFQSYAIFPHMTVRDNIGFGLKMHGEDEAAIARSVDEAAELLHIEELLERRPADMSGGQRQRVAVARALAMKAEVVLMDEPLSNLDALLRLEMRAELKRLLADIGATTVYVTHDQIEALSMGDRVAVMRDGKVQQIDEPNVVYDSPANRFVGSFIGNPPMNFIDATIDLAADGSARALVGEHEIVAGAALSDHVTAAATDRLVVGVRAENMHVTVEHSEGALPATVQVVEPLGSQNLLTVLVGDSRLKVSTHPTFPAKPDQQLWLRFPPEQLRWIDPATERVIYG